MTKQLNIKEVARAIGVSPATISRTLTGQGRVSAATRERVAARMKELGYIPNLNAQRLVTGRSHTIALVAYGKERHLFDAFSTELVRGIQNTLQARGYALLLDPGEDALHRWVKSRAVDGVIALGGGPRDDTMAAMIAEMGVPCVVIGHHPLVARERVGSVVIDLESGARQVARLLTELGHRRIGFIGSYAPNQILAALRAELDTQGIALGDELVRIPGPAPEDGALAARELLSLPARPTAIVTRTDVLAASVLHTAWAMGISVPADLSLIGHDDVSFAAWTIPPLTTVRVDCAEVSRRAIDTLLALLAQPETPSEPQILHTQLIPRATTAPPC